MADASRPTIPTLTREELEARVRQHLRRQQEEFPASVMSPTGEVPDFAVDNIADLVAAILPEIVQEPVQ